MKVVIVPKPREGRGGEPRLLRVKFPRVHVEDDRLLFNIVNAADRPPDERDGKQAQVASSGEGDVLAEEAQGRRRKLHQATLTICDDVREPVAVGIAVTVMMDWEGAAVVLKSGF